MPIDSLQNGVPRTTLLALLTVLLWAPLPAGGAEATKFEFFESRIRPVLVRHCYSCHSSGAEEVQGGLYLDTAAGLMRGGDSGPAVELGNPTASLLLEALRYDGLEMPPAGKLADNVVRDFERWIRQGAADPRGQDTPAPPQRREIDMQEGRTFWAFQPRSQASPPPILNTSWPINPVDDFVLAGLEEAGLAPCPDADRVTLLRRVYFDLIGLPPSPGVIEEFSQDDGPDAYTRLVDRLLQSRQFGVHWGRHWLDVARYADSNGSDFNATFHNAWRYRDYVVDAMNDDKPFDQFTREQIAGDLMPFQNEPQRAEQLIATGFLMVGTKMLSERDKEKLRMDVVDEQIDAVGTVFLGLTLGCARCHDHKFDPIPAHDYYALAGIFRSTRTLEGESQKYVSTWPPRSLPAAPSHIAAIEKHQSQEKDLSDRLRAAKQRLEEIGATSTCDELGAQIVQLEAEQKKLQQSAPPPLPRAIAVAEHREIGDCRVRIRGEHDNFGPAVPRGVLQVIAAPTHTRIPSQHSGRLELARWIASPEHPLTARVIVNRVWHHVFGAGIVRTVDNFGRLGERPTNPELLDYLAERFVTPVTRTTAEGASGFGWSVKRLVRELVLSHTYRISSDYDDDAWQIDAENKLLWRANRRRLPAESIRDSMLAISGRLDLTPGGSPVEGLGVLVTQNNADAKGYQREDSLHRSLYLPMIRNELPAILTTFDFADPDLVTGRRSTTNVPAQALLLMNSPFVMDCARDAAARVMTDRSPPADTTALIRHAFRLTLARWPTDAEVKEATVYLTPTGSTNTDKEVGHRLGQFIQVLFASTEFRLLQ